MGWKDGPRRVGFIALVIALAGCRAGFDAPPRVDISLTVDAPAPVLFGDAVQLEARVTNDGDGDVTALTLGALVHPLRLLGGTCGGRLAGGASCSWTLEFISPGVATFERRVEITYLDNDEPGTRSADVTLVGEARPGRVEARYPAAPNWNDYVLPDGSPCPASTPGPASACLHAGEMRRVPLPAASCDDVSASDLLGAFTWRCRPGVGGVELVTDRTRALADLVDASGWRPNVVTVRVGLYVALETDPATRWWGNPVQTLPPSIGAPALLDQAGTVYVHVTDAIGAGYNLAADRIGFVSLEGASVGLTDPSTVNCAADGEVVPPDRTCVLAAGGQSFLWIEADIDAVDADHSLLLRNVRRSRVQHTRVRGGLDDSLALLSSDANRLEQIVLEGQVGSLSGLWVASAGGNVVRGVDASAWGRHGVFLQSAWANVIADLYLTNNGANGLEVFSDSSRGNLITNVISTNNDGHGVFINDAELNVLCHVAALNNLDYGVYLSDAVSAHHIAAINNSSGGVNVERLNTSEPITIGPIAALHNQGPGLQIAAGGVGVIETLMVGSNVGDDCTLLPGGTGVTAVTCTAEGTEGSSTWGWPESTAVLRPARSAATSFVGPRPTDVVNPSDLDVGGVASSPAAWSGFENRSRAWAPAAGSFGTVGLMGRCSSSCQLWDWRLSASDTALLSVDGERFVERGPCPPSVDGNRAQTTPAVELFESVGGNGDGECDAGEICVAQVFLVGALERFDDGVGDDDGLCESDEACVFSPNLGAYQGEGELTAGTCLFSDGTVSGVAMHGWTLNGARLPGELDLSFAAGGFSFVDGLPDSSGGYQATALTDGRILQIGWTTPSSGAEMTLLRYRADGTLDPTFATDGVGRFASPTSGLRGRDLTVVPDGTYLAAGTSSSEDAPSDFVVIRVDVDGGLVPDFGEGGVAIVLDPTHDDVLHAIAVQRGGRIVLGGTTYNGDNTNDFALTRLHPDGTLDTSFGDGGWRRSRRRQWSRIETLAVDPLDRIVYAGQYNGSSGCRSGLAGRLLPTGEPDPSFGDGGETALVNPNGNCTEDAYDVVFRPDGSMVFTGGDSRSVQLVALLDDGQPDPSFGLEGWVVHSLSEDDWEAGRGIELDAFGRITVSATDVRNGVNLYAARFLADGTPDLTFGTDSLVSFDTTEQSESIWGLAQHPDGRLILSGRQGYGGTTHLLIAVWP